MRWRMSEAIDVICLMESSGDEGKGREYIIVQEGWLNQGI